MPSKSNTSFVGCCGRFHLIISWELKSCAAYVSPSRHLRVIWRPSSVRSWSAWVLLAMSGLLARLLHPVPPSRCSRLVSCAAPRSARGVALLGPRAGGLLLLLVVEEEAGEGALSSPAKLKRAAEALLAAPRCWAVGGGGLAGSWVGVDG